MEETKVVETKNEVRLRELDAKSNLPQKEAVLRSALLDLIAKEKAAKVRADEDKAVIEAAEKVVKVAEADLAAVPKT